MMPDPPAEGGRYYVRARGKISGPYDLVQLETLRRRGQLARFHEVSADGRTWAKAGSLSGIFEPPPPRAPRPAANARPSAAEPATPPGGVATGSGPESAEWYYAVGDQPVGPIDAHDLKRRIDRGEVEPLTLVWREGMAGWVAAKNAGDFAFPPRTGEGPAVVSVTPVTPAAAPGGIAVPVVLDDEPLRPTGRPTADGPTTNGLAIASLVLGLVGWSFCFGSLLAAALGAVALEQIAKSRGRQGGKGLALAGLALGIVQIAGFAAYVVLVMMGVLPGPFPPLEG